MRQMFCGLFAWGVLAACSSASVGGSGPCADLGLCCAEMTGAMATTCSEVAGGGAETSCTDALTSYTTEGACTGTPGTTGTPVVTGTCTPLEACCVKLTGAAQAECNTIVVANVVANCNSELQSLTTANLCGGTVVVQMSVDAGQGGSGVDATIGFDAHGPTFPDAAKTPPDTGSTKKDTGMVSCGTCAADCFDSCGHSCTGGMCKGTCTTECLTDSDCEDSCSAPAGSISCCDTTTNVCYATSGAVCPVAVVDAGGDAGGY